MLRLRDVVKHYPDHDGGAIRAVDGVSLDVERGQMLAVYGPSGSGKTTLLSLMAGLLPPDGGSILFGGRDIAAFDRHEAADYRLRHVGLVAQSAWMVPGLSAVDNAALKLLAESGGASARARVSPLLARVGLASRERHAAGKLSVGERQRVAIVRALSNDPELVLADEPTGNLDVRRSRDVLTLLAELCRERNVGAVIATHDPQAAELADRLLILSDGRLREVSHAVLLGDPLLHGHVDAVPQDER